MTLKSIFPLLMGVALMLVPVFGQQVKKLVDKFGTERTYHGGKLHSVGDNPSVKKNDGHREWHENGKLHRDKEKPAIIYGDGGREYYLKGKLHRTKKPALEWKDGRTEWWVNGKKHRKKNPLSLCPMVEKCGTGRANFIAIKNPPLNGPTAILPILKMACSTDPRASRP